MIKYAVLIGPNDDDDLLSVAPWIRRTKLISCSSGPGHGDYDEFNVCRGWAAQLCRHKLTKTRNSEMLVSAVAGRLRCV